MTRTIAALSLAALACGLSAQASAFTFTSGGNPSPASGTFAAVAGASTIDFESGLPVNATIGGLVVSYTGGAIAQGNTASINLAPQNDLSNYWALGTTQGQQGVITFSKPLSYFGFDWGTPDDYNTVTLFRGNHLLGSFTGNQHSAGYLNITAGAAEEFFDRIVFSSTKNAFETDNHAFKVAAIPEPSGYAMMIVGLLAVGALARKRSCMP